MNTFGIVLAAGKSERLPNKVLLPSLSGRPVIDSAIEYCRTHADGYCVVHNGGPIASYLGSTACHARNRLIFQEEPRGVISSIQAGVKSLRLVMSDVKFLVTFGDNIYSIDEEPRLGCASIRDGRKLGPSSHQLDGWYNGWVDREKGATWKFAGWLYLPIQQMQVVLSRDSLIQGMNAMNVTAFPCTSEWHDVGTPEAYEHYMRGGQP